jgi:asparagine synthase (glutamine-hydrolysing)
MIIAGVFNQVNENTFKKLASITGEKIKKDLTYFKNDFVNIIVGKTSPTVDQGEILKLEKVLLAGKVFSKDDYKALTTEELKQQSEFSNLSFTKKYWGNYLYITVKDKVVTILRDPVGQFPLFYTRLDSGECLFSSEIEILINMMKSKPEFNWKYFSSYLIHAFITTEQTAFNGIYELPHGCQLSFNYVGKELKRSVVWNPLDYLQGYRDLEDTKNKIISITSNVIKSWIRNAETVSLDFSGGTDSTGLLFLLNSVMDKNKEIKLINMFHPNVSSSDERRYAGATAKGLGLDLIEFDNSNSLPYDLIYKEMNFKPNWPTSNLTCLKTNADIDFLLKENKNTIYMSGHGGDHIFMCPPPVTSLCDYLIEQGKNGFNSKLKEISVMFRRPLFLILQDIIKGFVFYYLYSHYNQSTYAIDKTKKVPWFNNEILLLEKQMRYYPFFYEENTTKSLPGKFGLMDAIYSGLSTIKTDIRDGGTNPVFYPLFSQPLLELVLSIPTYESYRDGFNRYLFRKAISDTFKTNAVWRKDKGETSGITQRGLKKNEKRILELCLEGKIVKQGLINKEKLYAGMFEVINGKIDNMWAIISLVSAEIFMNYWN